MFCCGERIERNSSSGKPTQRTTKMGKEGDLWDDSALIQAFDDAISKYKVSSLFLHAIFEQLSCCWVQPELRYSNVIVF